MAKLKKEHGLWTQTDRIPVWAPPGSGSDFGSNRLYFSELYKPQWEKGAVMLHLLELLSRLKDTL